MKNNKLTEDEAQALAVEALSYIAGDTVLLPRFLQLTGIAAPEIRRAATEPGFLAGVLDFIIAHEPTLLAFAAAAAIPPERIAEARRMLGRGDERYERST